MTTYRMKAKVELTKVDDDLFLVHPGTESIYHLDPIGAGVCRILAEQSSPDEIFETLYSAFPDMDAAQLRGDMDKLIADLVESDLLDVSA
ncbi:MAG: PqqD family protein [Rhodospirillaceae bacterium]|jgi:hypothetical protein|nr:PqqD family protein [Rhodospirillaceae bacterium]MBT5373659.1 PqqD family protein [Rhodospirillaceae bacterium]MBT5659384.1 PqqD family protein [Rhodospirillaceae bacterium]MBT5752503.1 PqqD family protein [Rhodospirillaceae bacterium]